MAAAGVGVVVAMMMMMMLSPSLVPAASAMPAEEALPLAHNNNNKLSHVGSAAAAVGGDATTTTTTTTTSTTTARTPTTTLQNPRIVEHPTDMYVARNEPTKLNCKAEGSPAPKITWYRNGQRVLTASDNPASHRMLLNKGQQLFFLRIIHNKNAKPDVGSYYCNATNRYGSAVSRSASLQLAVLREDFRENPQPVTVVAGDSATLHCRPPRGQPEPKVLWRKNGSQLSEEGRFSVTAEGDLVIASAEPTDAGDYTCLARNKGGERESAPAYLTVLEKPTFRQMPDDVIAKDDDTVELKCSAIGDPKPTIQWQRENGRVPFGRARQLDDGTLWMERVQLSDDGMYVCIAENSAGSVQAVARLTVQTLPSFLIKPTNQRVGLGRTAILQCVVTGNPPPTVFWTKGKEQHLMFPNHEHGRYAVSEDGTLRIRNVRYEDAGQYVCNGLNALGTEETVAAIEVKEEEHRPPPLMIWGPQNQTLETKGVALLPCRAQGPPPPTLRWYHHGRPLVGSEPRLTVLSSGTLQISDLRISDSGLYTCRAFSETGESSWEAFLTVTRQGPFYRMPKASTFPSAPPKPQVTRAGDASLLLAWGDGEDGQAGRGDAGMAQSSPLMYSLEAFCLDSPEGWVKVAESVSGASHTVTDLKPGDSCVFVVRAHNAFGVSPPSAPSDPVQMPVLSQPPQNIVVHKEETTIHVRWSPPPGQQPPALQGYEIFCADDDRTHNCSVWTDDVTNSVQIDDVDPELTYRIRLAAVTRYGTGTWSETFVVGPEQGGLLQEPWFLGVVIGVGGGVVWVALCLFTVCLCRKRKHRKKMAQNGMYSAVPVQKPEHSHSGGTSLHHKSPADGKDPRRKDRGGGGGDLEGGEGGMYSLASPVGLGAGARDSQETALYQEPISLPKTAPTTHTHTPTPVEPYATTTIVTSSATGGGGCGGGGVGGTPWSTFERNPGSRCLDATFRPVNHAYVHSSASGSGDSGQMTSMRSADHGETTLANTGCHPEDAAKGPFAIQRSSNTTAANNNNNDSTDDDSHMPRHVPFQNSGVLAGETPQPNLHWTQLVPLPRGRPPPRSEMDSSMLNPVTQSLGRADFGAEGGVGYPEPQHMTGFMEGRPSMSSSSKGYACTCGGMHEPAVHGAARTLPCYSDSEWCCGGGGGGGGHSHAQTSRYPSLGPAYTPQARTMNAPPLPAMVPGSRVRMGGHPACHVMQGCRGGGGVVGEGVCPHHHHHHHHHHGGYYSDTDNFRSGVSAGSAAASGYGGDARLMLSDSESGGPPQGPHPLLPAGRPVGEVCPQVDRACQSSLPSLANECIHSPGGGSSRNLESPQSSDVPDYAAESESEAERMRDCPTPASSANGEEAAASSAKQGSALTPSP